MVFIFPYNDDPSFKWADRPTSSIISNIYKQKENPS